MKIVVVHPTKTGQWQVSRWTPRKLAYMTRLYRNWWNKRGRLLQMLHPEWWPET